MFNPKGGRRWFVTTMGGAVATIVAGCKKAVSGGASLKDDTPVAGEGEFDYIIIGSGAGGGPLAVNLSKHFRVLVIEAGADCGPSPNYQVPYFNSAALEDPAMAWEFWIDGNSEEFLDKKYGPGQHRSSRIQNFSDEELTDGSKVGPQKRGVQYPRAGTLGGCTAHNAMITMYPHDSDWTDLQKMTDDNNFAPATMRKYFQIIEGPRYLDDVPNESGHDNRAGHGDASKGWLKVERFRMETAYEKSDFRTLALLKAAVMRFEKGLEDTVARIDEARKNPMGEAKRVFEEIKRFINRDVNTIAQGRDGAEGVFRVPLAMSNGHRNGTREHLVAARDAPGSKLKIALETFVTRVLFEEDASGNPVRDANGKLKAIGVEYVEGSHVYQASRVPTPFPKADKRKKVFAKAEVILSCGAFNTPQLLMLSGIGPKDQIGEVGQPIGSGAAGKLQNNEDVQPRKVLKNLDWVGRNLQDRYEVAVVSSTGADWDLIKDCNFTGDGQPDVCFNAWEKTPTEGPYSCDGSLVAILKRSSIAANENPDLAIIGYSGAFVGYKRGSGEDFFFTDKGGKQRTMPVGQNETGGKTDEKVEKILDKTRFTWQMIKVHNRNRGGRVTLRSTNPWEMPRINFANFEEGEASEVAPLAPGERGKDLQGVLEGIQLLRDIDDLARPVLSAFGKVTEIAPGREPPQADEYQMLGRGVFPRNEENGEPLKQYIRDNAWGHHASCSCKMGASEQDSVVNNKFQVHGVSNLRIVDASVFPKTPGIFIVTPIYMISEKASDDILENRLSPIDKKPIGRRV
jgi:choline dehydrogenase